MSDAPERLTIESETGHANAYNSEDRKTWLHDVENAPEYFSAEYIRADIHRAELEAVREWCEKACENEAEQARKHNCSTEAVGAVWSAKAIRAKPIDEILKEARK